MNREHKYRLIHWGKIVGYEKWYPGKRHNPDSGRNGWEARPCWLYSVSGKGWTPDYIFHESKDEFTGIKDKDDKDIYEGDRQRWHNAMKSKEEYAKNPYSYSVVKWNQRRAAFDMYIGDDCEVVSSIHDAPEAQTRL